MTCSAPTKILRMIMIFNTKGNRIGLTLMDEKMRPPSYRLPSRARSLIIKADPG